MNFLLSLAFSCFTFSSCSFLPVVREFIPTTNFEVPENWDKLRTPCRNDKISFNEEGMVAIHISDNLTLVNFTLFNNGELIFGDYSGLTIDEVPIDRPVLNSVANSDFCHERGETIRFRSDRKDYWRNPSNWRVLTVGYEPLLHFEMIPNEFDTVYFAPSSSYKVFVETEVAVRGLSLGNQTYGKENFSNYLDSTEGFLQFQPGGSYELEEESLAMAGRVLDTPPLISVTGKLCTDKTGCVSNNLNPTELQLICEHVICTELPCSKAIKPIGHCCSLCAIEDILGAQLVFDADNSFDFQSLSKRFRENAEKNQITKMSLQKVDDFKYQFVVMPNDWESISNDEFMDIVQVATESFATEAGVLMSSMVLSTSVIHRGAEKGVAAAFIVLFLLAVGWIVVLYVVPSVRSGRFKLAWLKSVRPKVSFWRSAEDDDAVQLQMDDNDAPEMADVSPGPLKRLDETSSLTESMQGGLDNPSYYSLLHKQKGGKSTDLGNSFANPAFNPEDVEE